MFLSYVQIKVYQNILKLRCWPLALTLYIAFLTKTCLELGSLSHCLHDFWRNIFLAIYFISWPNFIALSTLLLKILYNMCIIIICCPVFDVINFEVNLNLLIKPFFYITKKSWQKFKYLENKKSFKHEIKSIFPQF